jgi:hypothetical protein
VKSTGSATSFAEGRTASFIFELNGIRRFEDNVGSI